MFGGNFMKDVIKNQEIEALEKVVEKIKRPALKELSLGLTDTEVILGCVSSTNTTAFAKGLVLNTSQQCKKWLFSNVVGL